MALVLLVTTAAAAVKAGSDVKVSPCEMCGFGREGRTRVGK